LSSEKNFRKTYWGQTTKKGGDNMAKRKAKKKLLKRELSEKKERW